ncbi:Hypothetical protein, putative [Bodo saltans]|uniref:Uncharacterized protein n=1 Tax=Bodo saltans TaxID=75058 RepID=A0A0S4INY6_BODSA|nr:Hypothetical protein, putative [Bodo saltans]|eukprot:CUF74859.1 Hypothetical protein, putative [Bodo saltans]
MASVKDRARVGRDRIENVETSSSPHRCRRRRACSWVLHRQRRRVELYYVCDAC